MNHKISEISKKGINVIHTSLSEEQALFGYVKLKFEIQKRNFYAMLVYYIVLGMSIFGIELQQQNVLLNSQFFSLDRENAADSNSTIILFDLLTKLLVSPLYRILVDKLGRKKLSFIGFGLLSVSFLFFPFSLTHKSSFNQYYFMRFIHANGIAILLSIPLLSDYIEHDSKGRCISINGFFLTLGFLFSTYIINSFSGPNLSSSYYVFALITLSAGNVCSWFLKSGTEYFRQAVHSPDKALEIQEDENTVNLQETPVVFSKRRLAIQAIRSRPWILVALMFSFLSGICFAISSQTLNLYAQTFNSFQGPRVGSDLVLKSNLASIVTTLVFGSALEFIEPLYGVIAGFALTILSSFSIGTVEDPRALPLTFISVGFGMAYSITHILTTYLGYKYYPTSLRGMFFGGANLFVTIGVIFTTVFGGWLFKTGDMNWPFYIAGLCSFVSLASFVFIYLEMIIPAKKKIRNKQELNLSLLYTSIQSANPDTSEIIENNLQLE